MKKKLNTEFLSENYSRMKNPEERAQMTHLCKFFNGNIEDDKLIESLKSNIDNEENFDAFCNKYNLYDRPLSKRLCLYVISEYGLRASEGPLSYWLFVTQKVASRFKEKVRDVADYIRLEHNERIKNDETRKS